MKNSELQAWARRFIKHKPSTDEQQEKAVGSSQRARFSICSPSTPLQQNRKLFESGNIFNYQSSVLNENRVVLYKKGKQLGDGFYIVEISSGTKGLSITTFNVEKSQSILLQISATKVDECLHQFEYNFEYLASCLRVEDKGQRLVLMNPYFVSIPLDTLEGSEYASAPSYLKIQTKYNKDYHGPPSNDEISGAKRKILTQMFMKRDAQTTKNGSRNRTVDLRTPV